MTTIPPTTPPTSPSLDQAAMSAAADRWATRAKPPGSLGRLEALAVHLAGVTGEVPPAVPQHPALAVFAGDHGVVADGASAWPSEITAAMVATIAAGGAAVNAFARTVGASVTVVDVGVASPLDGIVGVEDRRVRPGTDSIASGPAMTLDDAEAAIAAGRTTAAGLIDGGADLLLGGEMGIGNTTPSAAVIAVVTRRPVRDLTGPGAGLASDALDHKATLIQRAVDRATDGGGPPPGGAALLAEVGGLELGALAGLYVEAAARRVPFVVDGVIAAASLLIAEGVVPGTASFAIAGHRSSEPAASAALDHLGLTALLDLDLRLGEGTGAVLAVPLVQAAATALRDMAALPEG
ncbi:MAG: nicotinate-nucleotide--dimethylbenzimidazole phosphoribosyltransferase [Acidimicrobiales bacterium]